MLCFWFYMYSKLVWREVRDVSHSWTWVHYEICISPSSISYVFDIPSTPSSDAFALRFPGGFEKSKVMTEDEYRLLLIVHSYTMNLPRKGCTNKQIPPLLRPRVITLLRLVFIYLKGERFSDPQKQGIKLSILMEPVI